MTNLRMTYKNRDQFDGSLNFLYTSTVTFLFFERKKIFDYFLSLISFTNSQHI